MSEKHRQGELLAGIVALIAISSVQAVEQQAIDKAIASGVRFLRSMQGEDGSWPPYRDWGEATKIGATALAGLTLLECGVKPEDPAVVRAADFLRKVGPSVTQNYSICLSILFFDRLGDPGDIPLIESLTVRLLAGQSATGGWSYFCPPIPEAEVRRLQTKLASSRVLVGQREMPKAGGARRSINDVSPEIREQLALLNRMGPIGRATVNDNSNTQFAVLALWTARRYGLPVENAFRSVEKRFRNSQHADGGWGYFDPTVRVTGAMAHSRASITCAALLALAVAHGELSEKDHHRPDAKPVRDTHLLRGLLALSTAIGTTAAQQRRRWTKPAVTPQIGGQTYYTLWGLERVAVALDLKTIGRKDWYGWGAEILLAAQQKNGAWSGAYGTCGADTSFALLFLKRTNLAPDLTAQLAGRFRDPGERVLKRGEIGDAITIGKVGNLPSVLEDKDAKQDVDGRYPAEIAKDQQTPPSDKPRQPQSQVQPQQSQPIAKQPPPSSSRPAAEAADSPAELMAADLAKSTGTRHGLLLNIYRDGKGAQYTEALALVIPKLTGDLQRKTRAALAERLGRMTETTLKAYLGDENLEIRAAAARACAIKGSRALAPRLIPLLCETRGEVAEAAHQTLKELSGQDFGPKANASREERKQAARQWSDWWNKQQGK